MMARIEPFEIFPERYEEASFEEKLKMKEEISLDEKNVMAGAPLVNELIKKYCSGIKDNICSADSRKEAELIAYHAYQEFEKECVSEIIPLIVERHFKNLIQECWGNQK